MQKGIKIQLTLKGCRSILECSYKDKDCSLKRCSANENQGEEHKTQGLDIAVIITALRSATAMGSTCLPIRLLHASMAWKRPWETGIHY